jgi:hypothetical protein
MTGLRTNQNATPHGSQRCSTLIMPSAARTCLTGVIVPLRQIGQWRSRVSGSSASGGGMVRHRSMGAPAVTVGYATQPMRPGLR